MLSTIVPARSATRRNPSARARVSRAMTWLVAATLGLASLYVAILNWIGLARRNTRPHGPSWIPFVAGVLGAIAVALVPDPRLSRHWWVPLILDPGCALGVAQTAVFHLGRRLRGNAGSSDGEP